MEYFYNPYYGYNYPYVQRPRPYYSYPQHFPVNRRTTSSNVNDGIIEIPVYGGNDDREREIKSELKPEKVASKPDESVCAVKIQKVFRGYLVRKSVKKIRAIEEEVDEIERMIKESEKLIKKNEKERLKINEMIMRLLLKLDGVYGVDSGVRDFRKSVIKKALRLEDTIDSIISNNSSSGSDSGLNPADESSDGMESEGSSDVNLNSIPAVNSGDGNVDTDNVREGGDLAELGDADLNSSSMKNDVDDKLKVENVVDENGELPNASNGMDRLCDMKEEHMSECAENNETSSSCGSSRSDGDYVILGHCENAVCDDGDCENKEESTDVNQGNDDGKKKELLEKMVEENQRMMGLMEQLVERNERQNRLLSSLTQRVEMLERALMCEKSKKIKKKRSSVGVADCLESTQDSKKPGKR